VRTHWVTSSKHAIGIQEEVWNSQEASEMDYTVLGSETGKDRTLLSGRGKNAQKCQKKRLQRLLQSAKKSLRRLSQEAGYSTGCKESESSSSSVEELADADKINGHGTACGFGNSCTITPEFWIPLGLVIKHGSAYQDT
jgi:hypothetical protein